MPRKKKSETPREKVDTSHVKGLRAEVLEQPIVETLENNYMPYAMSVIVSRAIPEIDGFKPSHRKLLYTMYLMHLLGGNRTKSANIVGQTMRLNPHGDAAIYDTMVRLSRGYGALLAPYVDSKGNFGKVYSRDMAWAASRYTEARLDPICGEFFRDIDKDTVDFTENYDGTMQEPSLLPTTFPNVLVSSNQGIAVGMASNICGFNLAEVCDTAIARIKNANADLTATLKAPDFSTGGQLLYHREEINQIYETGRGSFRVRAKWRYDKKENLIEIYEIPYSTSIEVIMDKVVDLNKSGKIREISDLRDESDLSGLKLVLDLKRGTDPDQLMRKLFRLTPLQDSFACNFNILIAGMPRVMGVGEILDEWTAWRTESVRRRAYFEMKKKEERLHLLRGLEKILLDIDRAIQIIRETETEAEVVPNLMIGFGIDESQAEYVAEIKLRNINREYILRRTGEIETLTDEVADLKDLVNSSKRLRQVIIRELGDVRKKFGAPRRTEILYDAEEDEDFSLEEEIPDTPVNLFLSRQGYLKKITPHSLRSSAEQKYKDGDGPFLFCESSNRDELLVFTDRAQCYKTRLSDFSSVKASSLGDYLPAKLDMDEGENVLWACVPGDYTAHVLFCFENGKVARVPLSAYQTQSNRRRLTGAFSDKSPLIGCVLLEEECDVVLISTENRALVFRSASISPKATRTTQGVAVMTLKPNRHVRAAMTLAESTIVNKTRYRSRSLPVAGAPLKPEDMGEEQLSMT